MAVQSPYLRNDGDIRLASNKSKPTGVSPLAGSSSLGSVSAQFSTESQPSSGLGPIATAQKSAPTPAPVQSTAQPLVREAAPVELPAPKPSLNQYSPTGIGRGAQGGEIVSRVGAGGVPEFSNRPADQAQPLSLGSISSSRGAAPTASSLSSLVGAGGQPAETGPSFASLGSINNIGNGQGTFSQSAPGDAALANSRFERANQIRRDGANQDRLDLALARQANTNNVTVVGDSSRGLSLSDVLDRRQANAQTANQRQSSLEDVALAQGAIDNTQTQRDQQAARNRAGRLEELQVAATAPGATQEDIRNYQMAADPAGYLKSQQTTGLDQLKIQGQQLDNQIKEQTLSNAELKSQQAVDDRQRKQESTAATFDQALASVDSILGTTPNPDNPNGPNTDEDPGLARALGPIDGLAPTLPGSAAADFEARLDTLKAQTFLPQVQALKGAGALSDAEGKKLSDSIGALSTKMSEEAFRASLRDVKNTLALARERASPSGQTQPASGSVARVASAADYNALPSGSSYIDPNGNQRRKP